ncbi:MAG: RluA family pseudouridine synthase [Ottowia sp.]|nr:RluA family pseudouridine synthase [Ottowia sp.]
MAAALLDVDAESADQRLDNFLFRMLKGVPKSHVYRLIRSGQVRVNMGRAAAATRLAAGDVVRVPPLRRPARAASGKRQAPARAFDIVYEDEVLLAVDKPSGVAVHGGSGVSFGVIEQLRAARPQAPLLELVHRLDRGTSGVLLVAKRRSALRALQQQFRERRVGKTYLALVLGEWPQRLRVIDQPLHKHLLASGERHVAPAPAGDPAARAAVTLVRVRQRWPAYTLLQVRIKTGRTHQIRVHLAAQGFPVAGDDKYGQFDHNRQLRKLGVKRLFLHAWQLQFTHPRSGEAMELEAPLPPDLPLPPYASDAI